MNKLIIFCLLFSGCTTTQKTKEIKKIQPQKDWLRIYEQEIEIAIQNNDREAHYFFFHEWLREKRRLQVSGMYDFKPIPDYAK